MTADGTARLVERWARLYTHGLPDEVAGRRVEELAADVRDHLAHERGRGTSETRIALGVASRMVRGLPADAAWREQQVRANLGHPATLAAAIRTRRTAYRSALGLAAFAVFFLFWLIGAVGVIGTDGDRADMLYLGVFGVALLGAVAARLRPHGMARVLLAMATVQTLIAAFAILDGKHREPVTSLPELLGVNAMFVVLFVTSAWLFDQAARYQPPPDAQRPA